MTTPASLNQRLLPPYFFWGYSSHHSTTIFCFWEHSHSSPRSCSKPVQNETMFNQTLLQDASQSDLQVFRLLWQLLGLISNKVLSALHATCKNTKSAGIGRTFYTTWDISYAELKKYDSGAARLLKLLAYFGNQGLWYELFHDGLTEESSHWLRELSLDDLSFQGVMRALANYSVWKSTRHRNHRACIAVYMTGR
ncbi:hypothetical protein N7505_004162 [Penicillium chrysogenum]|uniref:Uncharacterized protein n=1 Tax=Penicillium chrysogenum TaxID=5076 RepID=A0ABQ8WSA9_PENCH|nr:hypothetical protein N7505_004162 [Penicillium chrysogenum]KAJ5286085.1 hypothetical protein N7524_001391 [Penicillium chrysogenum]